MISQQDEATFRQYVQESVSIASESRRNYEQLWRLVINDADVRQVIKRMLFIPHPVPDTFQGKKLIAILDFLNGREMRLPLYDDVVVTAAEITQVSVRTDSEGPNYFVTYVYHDGEGKRWQFERTYGYDLTHAAYCGWSRADFDAYWCVGRRITCHYRASSPAEHKLCEP